MNIKAALVDIGGTLFPFVGKIPQTNGFLSWREMSKVEYCTWEAKTRPEEVNSLHAQRFFVPVHFRWGVHHVQP